MLVLNLLQWWYGRGWAGVLKSTQRRLQSLAEMFSINILVRTLFSPWKRIITYPGAGLDAKLRAFGDNLVSRAIGFTIRAFVLLGAFLGFAVFSVAAVVEIVLWPVLPVAGVVLLVRGLL